MKFLKLSILPACAALLFCGCSDDKSVNDKLSKAVSLARQGNWQAVNKIADELSEDNPKAPAPMILKALCFEKNGDLVKATDLANQSVKANPKDFASNYTLGRLYSLDQKRQKEAFSILETALQLRPGDTNTLILLCNIGVPRQEANVEKYLTMLVKKTTLSNKDRGKANYLRGLYMAKNGKFFDSNMSEAARLSKKDNPELLLQIARVYDNYNKRELAKNYYTQFIAAYEKSKNPDSNKLNEAKNRLRARR